MSRGWVLLAMVLALGPGCTTEPAPYQVREDRRPVPDGPFLMGCPEIPLVCEFGDAVRSQRSAVICCDGLTFPLSIIEVSAFEIDRFPVTQGDYHACVQAGGCPPSHRMCDAPDLEPRHVCRTSPWQAEAYCRWRGGRLPTEAEWEKAARGTDGRMYPWGNEPPDCARSSALRGCGERPVRAWRHVVGLHPAGASPYGVEDMASEHREWTSDWFAHRSRYMPAGRDPIGALPSALEPDRQPFNVVKGGTSFLLLPAPTWERHNYDPSDMFAGFRCAYPPGDRFSER